MAGATLTPGFKVLAAKIQEVSLMQGDVCKSLSDAVNDYARGQGSYAYYIDHDGDGTEGNVVYCCSGDIRMAPYEIGSVGSNAPTATIDFDSSKNVLPVTQYIPEGDDSDNYNAMDEAFRKDKVYSKLPLYERFISTKTRKAADTSSFAGKGRSFPILKSEDVSAALHSIGRAGAGNYSSDVIKANIRKIAKAKGFALPDSLKDDSEAHSSWKPDGVLLVEGSRFIELPKLQESTSADFPIKLISPGRGSSGYYTPAVLQKAAEGQVFKAGTQMFWNHDTDVEEQARPEGDLNRLAAVTTTPAVWQENGHDGPGLYARAKVFSDYADKVREMGPHIGLSIRAGGERNESAVAPDGKPRVITALKNAASVDFVTKAGRDGKIFTESAKEEKDMDKTEVLALIKESTAPLETKLTEAQAENKKLREQLMRSDGPRLVREHLSGIRLPEAGKNEVIRRILETGIPEDPKALKEAVETTAKAVASFLTEAGYTADANFGTRMTEAEVSTFTEKDEKQWAKTFDESLDKLTDIFVGPKLVKTDDPQGKAAREARKVARKAFKEGRVA